MSSKRNLNSSDLKKYAWIISIVVALGILALNTFLSEQGSPLPAEITDAAATVLQTSLPSDTFGMEAETRPTDTLQSQPEDAATVATAVPENASTSSTDFFNPAAAFDYYVLALSWEPAFCEMRSEKPECTSQTATRFDATNFVLHGLWPNRDDDPHHTFGYCDVSQNQIQLDEAGDWCDLSALQLSPDVTRRLAETMPGQQSCLQNHEWYKHGTCSGLTADAYYDVSTQLVQSFSQTNFNHYIAANVGQTVDRSTVLEQFSTEFGTGTQDHLTLRCTEVDGVSVLTEIQITLKKDLGPLNDWSALFPDNPRRGSGNCPQQFKIDAVGAGNL